MKSTTINIVGYDLRLIYLFIDAIVFTATNTCQLNWPRKTNEILLKKFENLNINGSKLDTVFCAFFVSRVGKFTAFAILSLIWCSVSSHQETANIWWKSQFNFFTLALPSLNEPKTIRLANRKKLFALLSLWLCVMKGKNMSMTRGKERERGREAQNLLKMDEQCTQRGTQLFFWHSIRICKCCHELLLEMM